MGGHFVTSPSEEIYFRWDKRTIELKRTGTLPETGNLKPNFRLEPSPSTRYQHTAQYEIWRITRFLPPAWMPPDTRVWR